MMVLYSGGSGQRKKTVSPKTTTMFSGICARTTPECAKTNGRWINALISIGKNCATVSAIMMAGYFGTMRIRKNTVSPKKNMLDWPANVVERRLLREDGSNVS